MRCCIMKNNLTTRGYGLLYITNCIGIQNTKKMIRIADNEYYKIYDQLDKMGCLGRSDDTLRLIAFNELSEMNLNFDCSDLDMISFIHPKLVKNIE